MQGNRLNESAPMARDVVDLTPLESRDELVAWFEQGIKAPERFRIGTEHEKFGYHRDSLAPAPYDSQIGPLLTGLQRDLGWEPIMDGEALIGLADEVHHGAISLEPGGQFELSGAPLANVHETKAELDAHLAAVAKVSGPLNLAFMGLGMSPLWSRAETPVMPKKRYGIMTRYMPKVGSLGLDMMYRTCTVQTNIDFASEADMVAKLRAALALQPVITALFANSPFTEGKPNGFLSFRSNIWLDTDPHRTGMLPFAFEPGMGFERYVDYAMDVPLYFVKRGDTYHDVAGASFRDLMAGKLAQLPGERAVMSDWVNHLSTIFPEVRLKRYMEMRGADCGSPAIIAAMTALTLGLFYDTAALDGAGEIIKGWSAGDRQALRNAVPRLALKAEVKGRSVQSIAQEILALARKGLAARGLGEEVYLAPLEEIADSGVTQAERWLERFHGPWGGDVRPIFHEAAYPAG